MARLSSRSQIVVNDLANVDELWAIVNGTVLATSKPVVNDVNVPTRKSARKDESESNQ